MEDEKIFLKLQCFNKTGSLSQKYYLRISNLLMNDLRMDINDEIFFLVDEQKRLLHVFKLAPGSTLAIDLKAKFGKRFFGPYKLIYLAMADYWRITIPAVAARALDFRKKDELWIRKNSDTHPLAYFHLQLLEDRPFQGAIPIVRKDIGETLVNDVRKLKEEISLLINTLKELIPNLSLGVKEKPQKYTSVTQIDKERRREISRIFDDHGIPKPRVEEMTLAFENGEGIDRVKELYAQAKERGEI